MNERSKIFVAGHNGLVGSAMVRRLRSSGYGNLVLRSHAELDLADADAVKFFFATENPEYVILAAAKVGGIFANDTFPADFILQNLLIQTNVIDQAYRHGVKGLLFLGSSCIYPRDCPQPIQEEYFLSGPLEKTNIAYAVAKIAGVEMCHAYNRQYGTRYLCVMPTNLYGPGDNFDPLTSHVLPAMVRKFHEAKMARVAPVLWGTGTPRRELLHVDDLADACWYLLGPGAQSIKEVFRADQPPLINIGTGDDLTIGELANLVAEVTGYDGNIEWDRSKPDGTPRKLLDISRIRSLGWTPRISLREGVHSLYEWFRQNTLVQQ